METKLARLLILLVLTICSTRTYAQGTAFTYQGQLQNSGHLAAGTYNLAFSLFNTNAGGVAVAEPVTNNGVIVSNGLFTTTIDFGSGVFAGATNWLEIDVETNGASSFATLAPRQQLTPIPYAIFANTASNLSGTVSVSQLIGTVPQQQLPSNIITQNESGVYLNGMFSGDGSGLINTVTAANYVAASSSANQSVASPNVFQSIQFDNIVNPTGWVYSGGNFVCTQAGTYLVQYNAEVATTGALALVSMRGYNISTGSEILGSELTATTLTAVEPTSVSKSFLVVCSFATNLQFQVTASSTSAELVAGTGQSTVKPSISCTIVRIQ